MSYQVGNLLIDFAQALIHVMEPQDTLTCQELINAIREAEASEEGITYDQIATSSGKEDLGDGVLVGLTISLLSPYQVKWWSGNYIAKITGGNLVGGLGGDPVAYSAGVQVLLIQSAASTVVNVGGSALLPSEQAKLDQIAAHAAALNKAHYNRRKHDTAAGTVTVYDDDQTTPYKVFDADEALTEITPQ